MAEKVGEIFYSVTLDTKEMIDGQRKVDRQLQSTTGSLESFGAKLNQITQAVKAYAAATYLISQSDAYTKLNAQLVLATDGTRQLAQAQADVKRIAQEAQTDLLGVAVLYARITSATKELGTTQSQVADITRTVALALKVSGAGAQESASATLQLSQAFASGVLRGEEFNAIADAAPRLMRALADGIGVPIGALRGMAEQGKLTSDVLATSLPKALQDLEQEAKMVQTIGGAFQELRNEVMLFIGEQTTANGVVRVLAGGIGLLSDNLGLLAGVMATIAAVKFATWLQAVATSAYANITANQSLLASNLATAQAQVTATAATSALAAARVVELRAAVLSTQGATALAVTTNGLIPAQTRAAVAAEAHAAALGTLAVAQRAASATGAIASGVLGMLGGPLGAITTLLGLGATAWMLWGKSSDDASKQAANAIEASGREIIASLDKQNEKLRERLALAKAGNVEAAKSGGASAEKLSATLTEINALKAKGNAMTGSDQIQLAELQGRYRDISAALQTNKQLTGEISDLGQQSKASEWAVKYATDLERVNAEVAKAKKELGDAFTPELEQRIRQKIMPEKKAPKAQKSADAKFDDEGYLSGLRRNAASEINIINETETEKLRIAKKNLDERKISEAGYAEAVKLIQEAAEDDRVKLMAKTQADIDKGRIQSERETAQELDKIKSNREVAQKSIAAVDPIDAVRFEEEQKIAVLEEYRLIDIANTQLYEDAKVAVHQAAAEKIAQINAENAAKEQALQSAQLQNYSNLFGGVADLTKNFAGEQSGAYKAMFAVSKAFAIADSIIKIQQGIAGAAALPFPSNLPAIGAVVAATSGIISTISGASFGGARQYGGPVSSGSMYRVNETGAPEMFTGSNGQQYMLPTKSGQVTAADQVGGNVQWNVIVNNAPPGTTATVNNESRTVEIAIAQIANQIASNEGPVWNAMRGSTNVRTSLG